MAEGVDDTKEEQYLSKNESLVGLFKIDVDSLLEKYKSPKFVAPTPIGVTTAEEIEQEAPDGIVALQNNGEIIDEFQEWMDVLKEEAAFEKELDFSQHVKEDEHLDLNLGSAETPQFV